MKATPPGPRANGIGSRCLELNLAVVRGAVPDLRALDGALRGSATTADAAYALAVSAVIELARRNPSGSLDAPHGAADRGRRFRGGRAGHHRAHDCHSSRPSGARRSGGVTVSPPGCWPVADGGCWPFLCGPGVGSGGGPTCPAARPSTKVGRSPRKPQTRLNLTRTQER